MAEDPNTASATDQPDHSHIEPSPREWVELGLHFKLSPRQLQVVELLFRDCPAKALAHRLGCARSTASEHRHELYAKLGVADRTALVRKILEFCVGHPAGRSLSPPRK